jgi:arylsulfatase A-like enzyme
MVQWKGHIPGGRVDSRPVIQLDVLPTALAVAGIPIRSEWKIDGVNLLPFLTGENKGPPHETLYWRFGAQLAIRQGDWKLVKGPTPGSGIESRTPATLEGAELYNLKDDIGEKTNVAAQNPEKVRALAAAWASWNAELVEPKWFPDRGAQKGKKGAKKKRAK